jgi:hypothetical protein
MQLHGGRVTHVSGTICHPCLGPLTEISDWSNRGRIAPVIEAGEAIAGNHLLGTTRWPRTISIGVEDGRQ